MEVFYVDAPFILVVIFVIYLIKDLRKNNKAQEPKFTDKEMEKFRKEEADKFHKWWNENITPKYGIPFDSESENEKEDNE